MTQQATKVHIAKMLFKTKKIDYISETIAITNFTYASIFGAVIYTLLMSTRFKDCLYLLPFIAFLLGSAHFCKKILNSLNLDILENHFKRHVMIYYMKYVMACGFLCYFMGVFIAYKFNYSYFLYSLNNLLNRVPNVVSDIIINLGIGFFMSVIYLIVKDKNRTRKKLIEYTQKIDDTISPEMNFSKMFRKEYFTLRFEIIIMILFVSIYLIIFGLYPENNYILFIISATFILSSLIASVYIKYKEKKKTNYNIIESTDLFEKISLFQTQRLVIFNLYIMIVFSIILISYKDILYTISNEFPYIAIITNLGSFGLGLLTEYLRKNWSYNANE